MQCRVGGSRIANQNTQVVRNRYVANVENRKSVVEGKNLLYYTLINNLSATGRVQGAEYHQGRISDVLLSTIFESERTAAALSDPFSLFGQNVLLASATIFVSSS